MQKTLFALFFILYFTGCVERGQLLKPAPVHATVNKHTPIVIVPAKPIDKPIVNIEKSKIKPIASKSIETSKIIAQKQKNEEIKPKQKSTKVVSSVKISQTINSNTDDGFFNLSDETKNNISGFFILVIGIIILL